MKTIVGTLLVASSIMASAATIQFDLNGVGGSGLLSSNELGAISGSPGSGGEVGPGITFDDITKLLSINVGWGSGNGFTDLTGSPTGSHIHGPAGINANGGVVLGLPRIDSTAQNGLISVTTAALTPSQESDLMNGLFYINIHTGLNPAGEIRGNMEPVAVPEPSTALLGAVGLLAVLRRRRA